MKMMKLIVIAFFATLCINGLMAKNLVRRSGECQPNDGFVCPMANGMFPNRQCGKFWHCSNCFAFEKDCPAGLVWNDPKQICDWPENVKDQDCIPSGGAEATTDGKTTEVPESDTTTQISNEETTQGSGGETTQGSGGETTQGSGGETTQESEDETTQGSDETTQGSEDATTQGSDKTTQGSGGETTQESDKTTQGSGGETTQESEDETTTEGSADETTTQNSNDETETEISTTEQTGGEETITPTDNPSKPICEKDGPMYFKHSQCNMFWQCSNGESIEMTCAPGTEWNQSILVCDWPPTQPDNCQRV